MPDPQFFRDHEVAQAVYEILFRLYVEDRDGAAREAAARGVGVEALAASEITQAVRGLLAPAEPSRSSDQP